MEKFKNISYQFCKFQINGCKIIQDANLIESHEKDCDLRNVACIYQNCGGKIIYQGLEEHFKSSHGINLLTQSTHISQEKDKYFLRVQSVPSFSIYPIPEAAPVPVS